MSTGVCTDLNPFNFIPKHFLQIFLCLCVQRLSERTVQCYVVNHICYVLSGQHRLTSEELAGGIKMKNPMKGVKQIVEKLYRCTQNSPVSFCPSSTYSRPNHEFIIMIQRRIFAMEMAQFTYETDAGRSKWRSIFASQYFVYV